MYLSEYSATFLPFDFYNFGKEIHINKATRKYKKYLGWKVTKIGGLEMGADVRINGIKVGSVTKIDLDPETYMAMLELTIKDSIHLPKDTKAAVVDSGIMGDKYIRLEPGKDAQKLKPYDYLKNTVPYKSLEDNVREFIFLSTKDDVK